MVERANTVSFGRLRLQLPPSPLRAHYVKARVRVRQYPDGGLAVLRRPTSGASRPDRSTTASRTWAWAWGISKSQVSRLCEGIDQRAKAFLDRPIEGDWLYVWIDATYVKVRQAGRIVSVAVIVAVGVHADGRREVLGMDIGASEAETFWTDLLRRPRRCSNGAAPQG